MSDLSLGRKIHKFVGETSAAWNLQGNLSASYALPEMFRPVYKLLGDEERVDEFKQEFVAESMEKFKKQLQKANH